MDSAEAAEGSVTHTLGHYPDAHNALPIGQRLGEFEIRSIGGVGGFGIVYYAFDHALERDVAIKEYMPSALAARSATLHVSVLSQGHAETFALGLRSFINEARLLARFDHPSLVKVHRFWEGNGTAYMVMPLYRGRTLKALRQGLGDSPDESWLRGLLAPLLGALALLHKEGVYHRDISPDNILVDDDANPVLLDFGAARRVIGDKSQALTAILKPNYAPIEQYAEANGLRQGPWTDLYALGATLHYVITGHAPQPATARALGTDVHLLAALPRRGVSAGFLRIVDWMMAPRPEHRPQSVAALGEVLAGRGVAPVPSLPPAPAPSAVAWERTEILTMKVAPPEGDAAPAGIDRGVGEAPVRAAPRRWPKLLAALLLMFAAAAAWQWAPVPPTVDDWVKQFQDLVPVSWVPPRAVPEPAGAPSLAVLAATAPAASAPAPTESALSSIGPASAASSANALQATGEAATAASAVAMAAAAAAPVAAAAPSAVPAASAPRRPKREQLGARPSAAQPEAPVRPAARLLPAARSPSEQCKGRMLLALHRCLKRVCEQTPSLAEHADCRRVRDIEAQNAPRYYQ